MRERQKFHDFLSVFPETYIIKFPDSYSAENIAIHSTNVHEQYVATIFSTRVIGIIELVVN